MKKLEISDLNLLETLVKKGWENQAEELFLIERLDSLVFLGKKMFRVLFLLKQLGFAVDYLDARCLRSDYNFQALLSLVSQEVSSIEEGLVFKHPG